MKRGLLALLLCAILCAFGIGALAEEETPTLDIANNFDASDWSIGDIKWLSPLEDYPLTLDLGEEAILTSPMNDAWLTRKMFVADLDCECDVSYIYEYQTDGALLCQIKIGTSITDDNDLKNLISHAQALYDAIGEKCIAVDPQSGFAGKTDAFDQLLANDNEYHAFYWNGNEQIGAVDGKAVVGIMSVAYDPSTDEPKFLVSIGIAAKMRGSTWQKAD